MRIHPCLILLALAPVAWGCFNDRAIQGEEQRFRSGYGEAAPAAPPSLPEPVWIDPAWVAALGGILLVLGLGLVSLRLPQGRRRTLVVTASVMAGGLAAGWSFHHGLPAWYERHLSATTLRITAAPHTIPRIPGATGLRLAMVHDVVHQRYAEHGQAWYQQRVEHDERHLAALEAAVSPSQDPEALLPLLAVMDDLVVGYERLHRSPDALGLGERQLALLTDRFGPPPHDPRPGLEIIAAALAPTAPTKLSAVGEAWYRCYANLGTVLAHASVQRAIAGDLDAHSDLQRASALIEQALALKPHAHFGREAWQALAIRHILAAIQDPEHLLRFTLTGLPLSPADQHPQDHPRAAGGLGGRQMLDPPPSLIDHPLLIHDITAAAPAPAWLQALAPDGLGNGKNNAHDFTTIGFDQPTLAIIGMWIYGGGPNPHFALALGELMERIGQLPLAWSCYQRAQGMGERLWPDPVLRERLIGHCRQRQALIETALTDFDPAVERARHAAELAHGRGWQELRHTFEAEQLARGISMEADDFFADFEREHPFIASPVGRADLMHYQPAMAQTVAMLWWLLATLTWPALLAGLLAARLTVPRHRPPATDTEHARP